MVAYFRSTNFSPKPRRSSFASRACAQKGDATQHRKGTSCRRVGVPEKVAQERRARHRQQVSLHKRIWKLYREGYRKEQIAHTVGVSSSTVYRALEQETPPPPRRRSRSASIVDPYLSYLASRWNQGCHNVSLLYKELSIRDRQGHSEPFRCGCSLSSQRSTPCLETDHHLGQASIV